MVVVLVAVVLEAALIAVAKSERNPGALDVKEVRLEERVVLLEPWLMF